MAARNGLVTFCCLLTLGFAVDSLHAQGDASLMRSGPVTLDAPVSRTTKLTSETGNADPAQQPTRDRDRFPALALPLNQTGTSTDEGREGVGSGWFDNSIVTVAGALAITLSLFCCFVAIMRRTESRGLSRSLPKQALEVIGQTTIGPRQKLVVVRCANSALILGVSPAGIQTVAEFDEANQAHAFIASCRGNGSHSTFHSTLREMEQDAHSKQFVDSAEPASPKRGTRLFVRA